MIFVTIGSMLPFDRLIRLMDQWASGRPDQPIFAQIGEGAYEPVHMPFARMLAPAEFETRVREADLIVAHAGMGSIITAMEIGRPIIVLPRLAAEREHTTDHQLHTANWLRGKPGITVVESSEALHQGVDRLLLADAGSGPERISPRAPAAFTDHIRDFLTGGADVARGAI